MNQQDPMLLHNSPGNALASFFPAGYYPPHTAPMNQLMGELRIIAANPVVVAAYNDAIAHLDPFVMELGTQQENPWTGTSIDDFVNYFDKWFTFLPQPSSGLGFIVPLTFLYLNNPQGFYFLNKLQSKSGAATTYSAEIFNWSVRFVKERGNFMDSPESIYYLTEWLKFVGPSLKDYVVPAEGYKTFNEFFSRSLNLANNPRPISHPDDDSILVASADTEINFMASDLTLKTTLPVKTREINVAELLNNSAYAKKFVGGTALSCVLMPTNYHRYHAPVTGQLVEGMDVPGIYNGIMDGEHWFNEGDIGESDTNFSIFEDFHRAYFIIKTEKYGCVAMIPVGLNTISSIHPSVVGNASSYVKPGGTPVPVKKGQELGYFAYGGSLNILLFEPGVLGSISVLMGQRIGALSAPSN
ncbi:phosphatidylserine decarboxylase [Hymenobacter rubripertinctus]|nr:phosphatidylserine decarboxylase [Hymenobacter rubripertinctus]